MNGKKLRRNSKLFSIINDILKRSLREILKQGNYDY
jgi:hypothetical protein